MIAELMIDNAIDVFCGALARIDTMGPCRRLIFTSGEPGLPERGDKAGHDCRAACHAVLHGGGCRSACYLARAACSRNRTRKLMRLIRLLIARYRLKFERWRLSRKRSLASRDRIRSNRGGA